MNWFFWRRTPAGAGAKPLLGTPGPHSFHPQALSDQGLLDEKTRIEARMDQMHAAGLKGLPEVVEQAELVSQWLRCSTEQRRRVFQRLLDN